MTKPPPSPSDEATAAEPVCVCLPDAPGPDPWCAVHRPHPASPAADLAATQPDVEAVDV